MASVSLRQRRLAQIEESLSGLIEFTSQQIGMCPNCGAFRAKSLAGATEVVEMADMLEKVRKWQDTE